MSKIQWDFNPPLSLRLLSYGKPLPVPINYIRLGSSDSGLKDVNTCVYIYFYKLFAALNLKKYPYANMLDMRQNPYYVIILLSYD